MDRLRCWIWMLLAVLPAHASADARAWLDRNSMQLGETVTLNVETDDSTASEPDFGVLSGDFKTLGTQSSRQLSMSNGTTSAKTVWAIGLEPKRAGTLVIPSFAIGTAKTQALTLSVSPAATAAQGTAGDDIYIEVAAQPLDPYVQQQIRYSVKLYYAVNLSEGALDEPVADGVVVHKLGRDKQYFATVDGRRYQVLERNYALTPEQSGALTLPALGFRGSSIDNSDPGGFFRRGRPVSARSEAIELEVRSKPAGWGQDAWLPAASLSISDEGQLPTQARVGEPLTRTLKLRAQGLGFEQLPELQLEKPDGTDIYADKAETQTRDDGTWLYGERTRKFAIVPNRPGTLELPAIEIAWWNTAQDRLEKAVLPARQIEVLPAAGSSSTAEGTGTATDPLAVPATPTAVMYPDSGHDSNTRFWRNLALLIGLLWLITLGLLWKARRGRAARSEIARTAAPMPGRSEFLRACALGDLPGAERAMVAWARSERAGMRNLGELIAALADEEQRAVLDDLQRMRYAGGHGEGMGARLSRAFRSGLRWRDAATKSTPAPALPALYPGDR